MHLGNHQRRGEQQVAAADGVLVGLARRVVPAPGEPLGCAVNVFRRSDIQPQHCVAIVGIVVTMFIAGGISANSVTMESAAEARTTLDPLLRSVELAGHDPEQALTDAVTSASLDGSTSVAQVLHDAGYEDREVITWLFTADDTLPGRPVDALRENRGSEVKRRAQAMGF